MAENISPERAIDAFGMVLPTSFEELHLCVQKTGETLRSYISRWLSLRNTVENISPERAIHAFGMVSFDGT
jgi:hypothetical protein